MYGRVVQRPKSLDIGKQERVSSLLSKQLKLSAIISEITTCLTTTKDGLGQVFEGSEPTCGVKKFIFTKLICEIPYSRFTRHYVIAQLIRGYSLQAETKNKDPTRGKNHPY